MQKQELVPGGLRLAGGFAPLGSEGVCPLRDPHPRTASPRGIFNGPNVLGMEGCVPPSAVGTQNAAEDPSAAASTPSSLHAVAPQCPAPAPQFLAVWEMQWGTVPTLGRAHPWPQPALMLGGITPSMLLQGRGQGTSATPGSQHGAEPPRQLHVPRQGAPGAGPSGASTPRAMLWGLQEGTGTHGVMLWQSQGGTGTHGTMLRGVQESTGTHRVMLRGVQEGTSTHRVMLQGVPGGYQHPQGDAGGRPEGYQHPQGDTMGAPVGY